MRLTTRFGIGAAFAVLPLLGVIGYSVEGMRELARTNERLTQRHVIGLQLSAGVIARFERLDEYRHKWAVSRDGDYLSMLDETLGAMQSELNQLLGASVTPEEAEALARFAEVFAAFRSGGAAALVARDPDVTSQERDRLLGLAFDVQRRIREAAAHEAEAAADVRAVTRTTALWVASGATVLSLAVLVLTVRSLRSRLNAFIRGAHAVSDGAFSFQLDTSANDELAQVAHEFNRMVVALDELERMKADFISSVSHELRTPLVAMQETTQLLLEELLGPLTAKQRHMLELNAQAATRLSKMISDLLDLSRLRAGMRYSISEQDLAELTRSAVSELAALARERRVALATHVEADVPPVRCDPDRVVQIVQNLVSNALKYTPAGGEVEVRLGVRSSRDLPAHARVGDRLRDCIWIAVEDSGPGIPEPDRARVFEKFFRREGLPSDGSVGLGLAICREIAEAHGGSVWVEVSDRLGGAALHVALPVEGPDVTRDAEVAT
ncbi:MAG: HAMP domain-containing histidine kinase [Labilithrix sp.]|nr:HAMP domain-containing histidine kinase [Labilithrix sp.]